FGLAAQFMAGSPRLDTAWPDASLRPASSLACSADADRRGSGSHGRSRLGTVSDYRLGPADRCGSRRPARGNGCRRSAGSWPALRHRVKPPRDAPAMFALQHDAIGVDVGLVATLILAARQSGLKPGPLHRAVMRFVTLAEQSEIAAHGKSPTFITDAWHLASLLPRRVHWLASALSCHVVPTCWAFSLHTSCNAVTTAARP